MKKLLICAGLAAVLLAQNTKRPEKPAAVKVTESYQIDFSRCDTLKIEGNLERLDVNSGTYRAYWFRKYAQFQSLKITCEAEK